MVSSLASASAAQPPAHPSLLVFDVMRDGATVGEHVTEITRTGSKMTVTSRMDMKIRFLALTLYAFAFRAEETWDKGQLSALEVSVDDDGEQTRISVSREADRLRVENGGNSFVTGLNLMTSNHWNPAVLDRQQILNTLTGRLNAVTIEAKGIEDIQVVDGVVTANRYDYSGDLQDVSVWYDKKGRWVKLAFLARDGSQIEYRCRNCISEKAQS